MDNPIIKEPRELVPDWARTSGQTMDPPGTPGGLTGEKIRPKQRKWLLDLIAKKYIKPSQQGKLDLIMKCLRISEDPEEYGMSKDKATELIDWFLKQPDDPAKKPAQEQTIKTKVPDGYYALKNVPGHKNEVSFFRLRTPKDGDWKGYQFIDQVVGHGKRFPMKGQDVRRKLYDLIIEQGINEARQLYGQEFGRCGVCHRELTDDRSRAFGIGPDCRKKYNF